MLEGCLTKESVFLKDSSGSVDFSNSFKGVRFLEVFSIEETLVDYLNLLLRSSAEDYNYETDFN